MTPALLLLLSCAAEPAPPAANAAVEPVAVPSVASDRLPMLEDQAAYGDRWLAILGSYPSPGSIPSSLDALFAQPALDARPVRLDSSRFKALQPCYEVVVARAFDDVGSARAWSERLRDAGIEHYVKNAGAHVGGDPRVSSYCDNRAVSPKAGPDGMRFALAVDGRIHLPLLLDDVGRERSVEGAPSPHPIDELATVWSSPLTAQTLGTVSIGDAWVVLDALRGGAPRRCTVTGFAALTRGQPHFGWYEGGTPTTPGCGEPEPYAITDCEASGGDEALLIVPESAETPTTMPGEHVVTNGAALARQDPHFNDLIAAIADRARDKGQPLVEHWTTTAHGDLLLVGVHLTTGEGNDWCGSDDVNESFHAVYSWKDGQPGPQRLTWRRTSGRAVQGIARQREEIFLSELEPFGARVLEGGDGVMTRLDEAFCDCPC